MSRSSHSGIESNANGGKKYAKIMCCNMCAE